MKEQKFSFSHTFEIEVLLSPEKLAELQAQAIKDGKDPSDVPSFEFREFSYEVEAVYHPEERGHRDSFGAPEEPDYAAYVEILSLKGEGGKEVDFDSLEKEQQEALLDAA